MIRHGESEANRNWDVNVSMPNHLVPLTDHGKEQAHTCGQKIDALLKSGEKIMLVQSPYCRARQTAQGILDVLTDKNNPKHYAIDRSEDPRMREQDFGNFQEREAMRQILDERENYGMFFYRIPNGESPADVYDRCSSFCESLFRQFERKSPDVTILVSHGIWGRVFLMRYFRWEYEYFEKLCNLPNASPVVLELQENGKYILKSEMVCWQ